MPEAQVILKWFLFFLCLVVAYRVFAPSQKSVSDRKAKRSEDAVRKLLFGNKPASSAGFNSVTGPVVTVIVENPLKFREFLHCGDIHWSLLGAQYKFAYHRAYDSHDGLEELARVSGFVVGNLEAGIWQDIISRSHYVFRVRLFLAPSGITRIRYRIYNDEEPLCPEVCLEVLSHNLDEAAAAVGHSMGEFIAYELKMDQELRSQV